MAISFADNLDIVRQAPNVERDLFNDIEQMVAFSENYLPEVFECNVRDTGKRYRYNVKNEIDPILGKWREVSSDSNLTEDITSNFDVGGVAKDKIFTTGSSLESVIKTVLEGEDLIVYSGVSDIKDVITIVGLTKGDSTVVINANNQYAVIAVSSTFGDITIKDGYGFDNTGEFIKTIVKVGTVDYNIYVSKYKYTCTDFQYKVFTK